MALPTKSIRGLSAIMQAAKLVCRLNGAFRPIYVQYLTGSELAALDVLTAACQAFIGTFPLGG